MGPVPMLRPEDSVPKMRLSRSVHKQADLLNIIRKGKIGSIKSEILLLMSKRATRPGSAWPGQLHVEAVELCQPTGCIDGPGMGPILCRQAQLSWEVSSCPCRLLRTGKKGDVGGALAGTMAPHMGQCRQPAGNPHGEGVEGTDGLLVTWSGGGEC
jgi:hypothetical protein